MFDLDVQPQDSCRARSFWARNLWEIIRDPRKTFLVINVLHLIPPEIILKEFTIIRHQVSQDRFQCMLAQELLSQEMKIKIGHNSNVDICKKAVDHEFTISDGYSAEFYGQMSELQFDKFLHLPHFNVGR